jgi:ABC-type glycerol-3-phosphate transport system substrate-binding protein
MQAQFSRRRMLAVALVALAATPLAAACGETAPPTQAPAAKPADKPAADAKPNAPAAAAPAAAAKPQEIIFWPRSPSESQVVWEKITPIAKKMFPEVTVTLQAPPEDFNGKFLVAFAGGTAPDSGVTGLSAFRSYIGKKMLKTIQPYVNSDADVKKMLTEDYVPAATTGYSLKSELYATPTVSEAVVVFYNKDAMTQAGLTPPREIDGDAAKWNWNTFVDYAKKLTKGTGFRRERFGAMITYARDINAMSQAWGNFSYARGARFLDPEGENWIFTGKEAEESIQYIVDMIYKHDAHPDVGEAASANVLDRAFFQNGQVAMVSEGEYFSRYLWGSGKPSNGIPFAYDIAQMPFNPTTGKRTNIYHGNGSFLTTQSKNPDATWKWLRAVFEKESQQVITNLWGTRGAHRGTYDSWLKSFGNGGPQGINVDAIARADLDAAPYPTTPYLTPNAMLEPTMRVLFDNVFQNKMPVAAGIAQIDKETKALLEKGKAELPK